MTDFGKWHRVWGANYLPSYARNATETLSKFDREVVDRELGFARSMGLNSVRMWLSYASYEVEPKETVDRLGELIELCGEHGLTIMPILFDSCGVEPEIFRAKGETAEPHWRRWMPNPGYSRLGEEHWPELDRYVEDIVGPHRESAPVLAWNIMNEPWAAKIWGNPEQKRTAEKFVRHYFGLVRELKPEAPLTFSATFFDRCATLEDEVDVICYHSYATDLERWTWLMEQANAYSQERGQPVLLTEWGFPTWGEEDSADHWMSDDEQLAYFKEFLPPLMESRIGWYCFDLIMGYGPFSRMSLLKPNGDRRPASEFMEGVLKSA